MIKKAILISLCCFLMLGILHIKQFSTQQKPSKPTESIFSFVQSLDNTIYKAQNVLQKAVIQHKQSINNKDALLAALSVLKAGKQHQKLRYTEELIFNKIRNHLHQITQLGQDKTPELQEIVHRAAQRYLSFAHNHIKFNDTGSPLNAIHFMRRGMYYNADYPNEAKKNIWKKLVPTEKKSA